MKENFEIVATTRDVQGKGSSRRLRHEGQVPGIIYGGDAEPTMFATAKMSCCCTWSTSRSTPTF